MNFKKAGIVLAFFMVIACTFTQKMRDGEMAFEYKHYQQAITMLSEEYAQTRIPEIKAKKAFLIAEAYVLNDELEEALTWYRKAYEDEFGDIALAKFARVLKRLERYEGAIKIYDSLLAKDQSNPGYRLEKSACERAIRWQSSTPEYVIEAVSFNSSNSDYAPVLYENGQIVFTSDRPTATGEELYAWTGHKYADLYITDQNKSSSVNFSSIINSSENEGSITFSSDFSTAIFTRCGLEEGGDGFCKLYTSRKRRYGWTEPTILEFVLDGYNYMHPTLANTDSILIFSAQIEGGQGGYDLYYSLLSEYGWDRPVALSNRINTPDDEKFPYLFKDTLYFSSNKQGGMGGLDIYKTWQMNNGDWVNSQFLPVPINSGADDFGIVFEDQAALEKGTLKKGYFSSSRNAVNKDDIFSFKELIPVEDTIEVIVEEEIKFELFLAIRVVENQYEKENDPNSDIVGKTPIGQALVTVNGKTQETDANGNLIMQINFNSEYQLAAGKPGYLRDIDRFNTNEVIKDPEDPIKTINRELVLGKIFVGKEIVLENIYYDLDKWFIRDDAKPTLDSLARIMAINPFIKIQLGSHTDCRGDVEYNLDLSHKRAKSATDYLIELGIPRSRLRARGFGKGVLIEKCACETCTEEEHQRNRRTTFTILE